MNPIVTLALLVTGALFAGCASLPSGQAEGADDIARAIEKAVDKDAWDATGAVRFGFLKQRQHVWDMERDFFYMKRGDDEVWLDLWDRGGVAKQGGVEVTDEARRAKLLADAWTYFCNDTFWLNPLVKLFDEGTTRELVARDELPAHHAKAGRRGLKVSYASGGKTPGDAYLWILDETGKPVAVRMWVSALPVKGIEFSWEGWTTLATGAQVATVHEAGPASVAIDEPAGAATLAALEPGAPDRFAALVQRRAAR